jgi:hypothetical protein
LSKKKSLQLQFLRNGFLSLDIRNSETMMKKMLF